MRPENRQDTAQQTGIDRAFLRARLAAPRSRDLRSDVTNGLRLIKSPALKPAPLAVLQVDTATAVPYDQVPEMTPIPAAVLVPLIERCEGYTVLLTQRTAELKAHAGQISFPGGRIEPTDADAVAGALRETEEEVGLAAAHIEIVGQLDPYLTITGFNVTPVVGVVTPPFDLRPDSVEVADIFEVPLAFFMDPANHQRHSKVLDNGVTRAYYAIPYGERYVWGATAAMLMNLYEVLTAGT